MSGTTQKQIHGWTPDVPNLMREVVLSALGPNTMLIANACAQIEQVGRATVTTHTFEDVHHCNDLDETC